MTGAAPRRPALWPLLVGGFLATGFSGVPAALAHEVRPAYLEISAAAPDRYEVLWRRPVLSGRRLAVVLRLPDAAHTRGQPAEQELRDSVVERRAIELPGGLAGKRFDFVGLETTITDVLVRVQEQGGTGTTALVRPSQPWLVIPASRGPAAIAGVYLRHGVEHILFGYDHLLFVLVLCLIVASGRALLATITAFTVAHSITLALATLGVVRAPAAPVEATIALSIVLLACEVLGRERGRWSLARRWPWVVAFCFGLLHGLGFASALVDIGLPSGDVPLALLAFNVGVELGQVAFIAVVLVSLRLAARLRAPVFTLARARPAAYAIGTIASFWFFERLAEFVP
jgi:hydrogenase/urease accessory protein HupE